VAEKDRSMKTLTLGVGTIAAALSAAFFVAPLCAEEPKPNDASASPAAAKPNDAEMMKQMMELAKLNDNHKLLASLDGIWTYTVKMWMNGDPSRISLPLMTFSLPSLPASTEVAPGFSLPSTTARIT